MPGGPERHPRRPPAMSSPAIPQRLHNDQMLLMRHFQASIGSQTRSAAGGSRGMEDRTEFGDQSIGGTGVHGVRAAVEDVSRGPGLCGARLRDEAVDLQRRRVLLLALTPSTAPAPRQEDRLKRGSGPRLPTLGRRDQPRVVGRGRTCRHLGRHARLPVGPPRGRDARRDATMAAARGGLLRGDDPGRSPGHRGHGAAAGHRQRPGAGWSTGRLGPAPT